MARMTTSEEGGLGSPEAEFQVIELEFHELGEVGTPEQQDPHQQGDPADPADDGRFKDDDHPGDVVLLLWRPNFAEFMELKLYDLKFRFRGAPAALPRRWSSWPSTTTASKRWAAGPGPGPTWPA